MFRPSSDGLLVNLLCDVSLTLGLFCHLLLASAFGHRSIHCNIDCNSYTRSIPTLQCQ